MSRDPIPPEETAKVAEPVISQTEWPRTRTILRVLLIVLATTMVLWMLHALRGVLLLVILAIFFAYLVTPLVKLTHRFLRRGHTRKTHPTLAIGIVYLCIFGSIGIAVVGRLPQGSYPDT